MTAQILQEELVKEIGVIFRDDLFKDSAGEYIKMNVYEQNLPIRQDEDAPDPIPYVIVRVETGQAKGGVEPQEVFVTLLIGYFDDDAGNNGHKTDRYEPRATVKDINFSFNEDGQLQAEVVITNV